MPLVLVVWCGIKNGFGTRTTTIFVGTRKYAKIRVPAPKSDTGTRGTTPFRSKARWVKLLISLERHFRNLDRVEDPKRFH